MGIKVITEFVNKTTVRVLAYVYDDDDALTDPTTSIKVTITDKEGTAVADAEDMALEDAEVAGIYEYYLATDADFVKGQYRGEVWVIDGEGDSAKTSSGFFSFKLN